MVPEFKSSFIPKGPVTESAFEEKNTSVLGMLVMAIFILVLVFTGLLFAYKIYLQNSINDLSLKVSQAESTIDRDTIDSMSKFSNKIKATREILTRHQAVSNILGSISSSTVSTIQFTNFSYVYGPDNTLIVGFSGKSRDYASIALQESVLMSVKEIVDIKFSNMVVGSGGVVNFDLSLIVNPDFTLYNPPAGSVETSSVQTGDTVENSLDIEDDLSDLDISLPEINDL
jgi:hypothetical protein